ncbi:MAG: hypothetical protein O2800_01025 [Planctomycetota bacterium]|nr:hypothetical protein [Planctomycetota bacterium]
MFGPSPTPFDPSRDYGAVLPNLLRQPRAELEAGVQKLRVLLSAESVQTREMLEIYARASTGKASREEVGRANDQMMDLIRLAGLGTFFTVVPGSMLLLPLMVAAATRMGIRLLPDTWVDPAPPEKKQAAPK